MKRSVSITLAVMLAAALLLSIAFQANAQANRIEVEFYENDCLTGIGDMWEEGQVLHMRNVTHTNFNYSDSPYMKGINTTVADAEFNLKTGSVVIRGTSSIQPYGINGTWEGTWTFIGNNGVLKGEAIAHGTGDLFGKTLFLNLYDAPPDPDLAEICQGIDALPESTGFAKGYILDTGRP
jgi:hypothetical protein